MIERIIRLALRQGWDRGVIEGTPVWVVVGAIALLAYLAGRVMPRQVEVVFSEPLGVGEGISITHEEPS